MKTLLLIVLVCWVACSDATPAMARGPINSRRYVRITFADLLPWFFEASPSAAPTTSTVSVTTRAAPEPFIIGRGEVAERAPDVFTLSHTTSISPTTELTTSPPSEAEYEDRVVFPGERSSGAVLVSSSCMNEGSPSTFVEEINSTECSLSNGEIMYNSSCQRLLAKGKCAEGEWLVLVEEVAECQPRPCPFGQLEYKNECVAPFNTTVCAYGQMLYVEMTGQTYCDCEPDFIYDRFSGNCYAQYEQGPCTFGNYLEFSGNCSVYCVPNDCEIDGFLRGKESNITCYKKMYYGFCDSASQVFHQVNNTVECNANLWRNIFDVATLRTCPPGSRRDHIQKCRQLFKVPSATSFPSLYGKCSIGFIKDPRGSCRRVHSIFG